MEQIDNKQNTENVKSKRTIGQRIAKFWGFKEGSGEYNKSKNSFRAFLDYLLLVVALVLLITGICFAVQSKSTPASLGWSVMTMAGLLIGYFAISVLWTASRLKFKKEIFDEIAKQNKTIAKVEDVLKDK